MAPAVAAWTVHTDVFEGPLDLLLYLVRRDGVDLRNLEVARIADSYLGYLDRMRELNLSVAGDYLVMAATLVHLKSLELLPRPPAILEDEEEDPRSALARQLQEYARYKEAAEALELRPRLGREELARPPMEAVDSAEQPVEPGCDAFGLLERYHKLLVRRDAPEPVIDFAGSSGANISDVARRIVKQLLDHNGVGELTAMLTALATRAERVIAFLAVLEMAKLHWVDVEQASIDGPVTVTAKVKDAADADFERLTSHIEEDTTA